MRRANIRDRASIERIYPRAVFDAEGKANLRAMASVLNGVSIASAIAEDGAFDLVRASRHVGEQDSEGGAIFLCPFAQKQPAGAGKGDEGASPPPDDPYAVFIDKIIATARDAPLDPSPGPGDARLRGARQ